MERRPEADCTRERDRERQRESRDMSVIVVAQRPALQSASPDSDSDACEHGVPAWVKGPGMRPGMRASIGERAGPQGLGSPS